jgi:hypothetical protein
MAEGFNFFFETSTFSLIPKNGEFSYLSKGTGLAAVPSLAVS